MPKVVADQGVPNGAIAGRAYLRRGSDLMMMLLACPPVPRSVLAREGDALDARYTSNQPGTMRRDIEAVMDMDREKLRQ